MSEYTYTSRISIASNERLDVVQLAAAVEKFGTVVSVSSTISDEYWED